MEKPKVVYVAGIALNLADLKSIKNGHYNDSRNLLIVEFKSRRQYIKNPQTDEYELQEFNDFSELEFYTYDSLIAHREEIMEAWQEYLDKNEQ